MRRIAGNWANDLRTEIIAVNGEETLLQLRERKGMRACEGIISDVINHTRQPANLQIHPAECAASLILMPSLNPFHYKPSLQDIAQQYCVTKFYP